MSETQSFAQVLANLRDTQRAVLDEYNGGRMGISAVPGSGKTYTLSTLAADIILSGDLELNQEILIVTLSNSAVDNFSGRISSFIGNDVLPGMGYRVRTLHGLAHDIVRERPSLVNLANDFTIIDERDANSIREQAANAWLHAHPDFFTDYLSDDLSEDQLGNVLKKNIPNLVQSISLSLIRYAKDCELSPEDFRGQLKQYPLPLPLAEMACDIYQEYQRSLIYRGAVDFDDLIRLALRALRTDDHMVTRLRKQWPFILEDEAQDSSHLQEEILKILTGEQGNWVRVGDPNQAIYDTFTTASPLHLIDFMKSPAVLNKELPVSGRSSYSILRMANHLIDWTHNDHPISDVRDALRRPLIVATSSNDPKPNPVDDPHKISFLNDRMTSEEEHAYVVRQLLAWDKAQGEKEPEQRETLVVLDLRNERGARLADLLRKAGLDPIEMLGTTSATRKSAGTLTHLLRCIANPQSPVLLRKAFNVWRRADREDSEAQPAARRAAHMLDQIKFVEDYLYPLADRDWLESTQTEQSDPVVYALLSTFRQLMKRWHRAALLPIDQLILTLAQDLFDDPADLAVAHKLAAVLRQAADRHTHWQLPELSKELEIIARNQRRFIGFSDDDSGFDPERYRGRVLITTLHKAKGQEWDRVFLLSANNFNFPSGMPYDEYFSNKWFLQGKLNLEAEALQQLKTALSHDQYSAYETGQATITAQLDCVRERLRLLYVAITRARRALHITWNTGQRGNQQPALAVEELQTYWEKELLV